MKVSDMKKNYLKPAVQAQIFTVKSVMLEESSAIGGDIGEGEDVLVKEDFDNFFE